MPDVPRLKEALYTWIRDVSNGERHIVMSYDVASRGVAELRSENVRCEMDWKVSGNNGKERAFAQRKRAVRM
jgi:hypothetical protein